MPWQKHKIASHKLISGDLAREVGHVRGEAALAGVHLVDGGELLAAADAAAALAGKVANLQNNLKNLKNACKYEQSALKHTIVSGNLSRFSL